MFIQGGTFIWEPRVLVKMFMYNPNYYNNT